MCWRSWGAVRSSRGWPAASWPNSHLARALRFLATLTGLSAPDTPVFRRYHRRLNRVAGGGLLLIGAWLLAYALTGFGHWLVTQHTAALFWGLPLGVPALLALPTWAVRLTRPKT